MRHGVKASGSNTDKAIWRKTILEPKSGGSGKYKQEYQYWTKAERPSKGNLIDYAYSEYRTDYPDEGEQEGIWFEFSGIG